ncbi:craniofacial development protein 1-like isoform X2 [Oncorhynchus masou masou]|uniref:craniofacial development protein 1-like isoform X2 n=1 Tax=Oncorhynchus masou masou TaxID=90313 RepID=UPI0031842D3F
MMNYSDYDSDGYSSNADQDYVLSDDNLSEDDMNECVKEDGLEGDDQHGQQSDNVTKKKKKKGQHIGMRKRKKGGLKLEESLHDGSVEDQKVEQGEEREFSTPRPKKEEDEQKKKKKADDLWASFLSDVGHKSKPPTPVPQATTKQQAAPTDSPKKPISAPSEPQLPEPKEPSKVTITKVFDFAGEEVRVTKEVDADSKEAKSFLKAKEETPYVQTVPRRFEPPSLAPGPSVKRPVGMSSILNRLGGKKQKMSTLEKSKMDWNAFKDEEGIGDELAIHNRGKEGYVERKNFLERVDHRQFEQEKKVRLGNIMKR